MKRLFLDMDGVIVDWCKGAHEIHGLSEYDSDPDCWPYKWGPEGWDFNNEPEVNLPTHKLFEPMGRGFWASLGWTKDGNSIATMVDTLLGENWCLLTNPWNGDGVIDGRRDWISRELPNMKNRVLVGACKSMCASPNAILVDDYDKNIDEWRKHGGIGFLYPRPWNSAHPYICRALYMLYGFLKGQIYDTA